MAITPVIANIYKTGSANSGWSGTTKMVTILVQDKGLEEIVDKNTTPMRWPQMDSEDPKTQVLDLKFPLTHTFEITGVLSNCIQTLLSSSASSGATTLQAANFKAYGFSSGTATITSPDGATSETISISSATATTINLSSGLNNDYPANSIISQDLSANPKSDLIAIAKDQGTVKLVYRNAEYTVSISKISFRDTSPLEEEYEVKISVFEGEELK